MQEKIVLFPGYLCETLSGDMAYAVGRLAFLPGRPMLVEHVGGFYLEHSLSGQVLTSRYGPEYNIVHVEAGKRPSILGQDRPHFNAPAKPMFQEGSWYRQSLR